MTAATLSRLPLAAGGTLVGSVGRGGYWTLSRLFDIGVWGAGQFMRAPLAISVVVGVAGLSLLAGSNALYFQKSRHPAPLFFAPVKQVPAPAARPVVPAPRPRIQPASIDQETTGSLGSQPAADPIGSDDVLALQQKLVALKLLDGTPDGLFGRRTASAIKAFEVKAGRKPDGRLTPTVLAAILSAPMAPAIQALPAVQVAAAGAPIVASAPAAPRLQVAPSAVADAAPVPLAPMPRPQQVAATSSPDVGPPATLPQIASSAALPPAAIPHSAVAPPPIDTFASNTLPVSAPPENGASAAAGPAVAVAPPPALEAAPATAAASPVEAAAAASDDSVDTGASSVAMSGAPAATNPFAAPPAADASLTPGQRLAAQMGTLPPDATAQNAVPPATTADDADGSTDPALITRIQRGLASLGFLGAKIDGVPGEGTAKAIRNFEVFYDYRVTGLATHQLLNLLVQHGATL